jgi:hypothetical protein
LGVDRSGLGHHKAIKRNLLPPCLVNNGRRGGARNENLKGKTHKDIFPPAIVPRKVQPMLPQIVVRRALGLHVDKVRAARARVAPGSDAQGEVSVVRHVVRELAEQRRAELSEEFVSEPCGERERERERKKRKEKGG